MLIKSLHLGRYISFKWQVLKISASQGLGMEHSLQLEVVFVPQTQRNYFRILISLTNNVLNVLLFFMLNLALITLSIHSSAMVPSSW